MGGRHNFVSINAVTNGDMSQASVSSTALDIRWMDNVAVQFNFSTGGTPVGVFFVNGSNDGSNWAALTLSPAPNTTGGTPVLVNLNFLSFAYLQVGYTRTSGSGSLNAIVTGKQL